MLRASGGAGANAASAGSSAAATRWPRSPRGDEGDHHGARPVLRDGELDGEGALVGGLPPWRAQRRCAPGARPGGVTRTRRAAENPRSAASVGPAATDDQGAGSDQGLGAITGPPATATRRGPRWSTL